MDDRLLWVVPPWWGWAAAALGIVIVTVLGVSARGLVLERRSGRVRTRAVVTFWSVAILVVLLASALGLFLLHNRVEFENVVLL